MPTPWPSPLLHRQMHQVHHGAGGLVALHQVLQDQPIEWHNVLLHWLPNQVTISIEERPLASKDSAITCRFSINNFSVAARV